jgi:cobalamin synthase
MKVKKSFIVQCAVGAVLLIAGLLLQVEYYSTLIFAVGVAILASALTQQARLCYWTSPKHRTEYEARQQEAHIDRVDERKQYLRMWAGYVTYQIMTLGLLGLAFVLALFRAEAWVIAMVFGLFILQWVIGTAVYRRLEKQI